MCATAWPENMNWLLPKRKRKNGRIIIIEEEPNDRDSQVTDRTRRKTRRVEPASSLNGDVVAQHG